MGVDTNFVTFYGVKAEWDDDFNDDYNEMYDSDELDLEVIFDGMCCKYMLLGQLLCYMSPYSNQDTVEVNFDKLAEQKQRFIERFTELFPKHVHLIDKEWKVISLIHYT